MKTAPKGEVWKDFLALKHGKETKAWGSRETKFASLETFPIMIDFGPTEEVKRWRNGHNDF